MYRDNKTIILKHLRKLLCMFLLCWNTLAASCCSLIDGNSSQYIWQKNISTSSLIFADIPITDTGSKLIIGGDNNGKQVLYCLDKATGKNIWQWSDFITQRENIFSITTYIYQQNFVFQTSSGTYIIDIETGRTISKKTPQGDGGQYVTGIGEVYYYKSGFATIFQGNLRTGVVNELDIVPKPNGFRFSIQQPTPFITQNGDTMLVMITTKVRNDNSAIAQSTLLCYNLTQRRIVYDSLQQDVGSVHRCIIANNKIYLSGNATIRCHDLTTGRLIWRQEFTAGFLFSGIIVADGKVFGACEDTNLYGLDAETGRILWKHPIAGTTRRPFYMNGVVYISKGKLYAVDAITGEILWNRECPEQAQNSSVYFFGYVTGSEGKIYVQSYKSAYCYKAAR